MHPSKQNIGAFIKSLVGVAPKNSGSATTDGAAIDRMTYGMAGSCVLHHACGAATGAPSAQTVDSKIQDSADGSTGWADVTGGAATQLTADSTQAEKDVDLSSAKRYIRVRTVVALTAGTTPALPVAATVTLGGSDTNPV
jgi:hypothetical protein